MDFLWAGAMRELIQHHFDHLDLRTIDPRYAALVEADVGSSRQPLFSQQNYPT